MFVLFMAFTSLRNLALSYWLGGQYPIGDQEQQSCTFKLEKEYGGRGCTSDGGFPVRILLEPCSKPFFLLFVRFAFAIYGICRDLYGVFIVVGQPARSRRVTGLHSAGRQNYKEFSVAAASEIFDRHTALV